MKLHDEDRRAVDLFLNKVNLAQGGKSGTVAATASLPVHVSAVANVLSVLQIAPIEDPPADLISRTMRRIEQTMPTATNRPVSLPAAINGVTPLH